MKTTKIDQITSVILLFLGIIFYSITKSYSSAAAAFPKVICIIIIILAILLFLFSLNSKFLIKVKEEKRQSGFVFWQFFSILIMTILYYYLIVPFGFFKITPIYLFCSMFFLRVRNGKLLIIVPLASTILLFLVFRSFLNVPLP